MNGTCLRSWCVRSSRSPCSPATAPPLYWLGDWPTSKPENDSDDRKGEHHDRRWAGCLGQSQSAF